MTKPDLHDTVTSIAKALKETKQHLVLRTETEVVGAFLPAEQADQAKYVKDRLDSLSKRLEILEAWMPKKESEPVVSEDKEDARVETQ